MAIIVLYNLWSARPTIPPLRRRKFASPAASPAAQARRAAPGKR